MAYVSVGASVPGQDPRSLRGGGGRQCLCAVYGGGGGGGGRQGRVCVYHSSELDSNRLAQARQNRIGLDWIGFRLDHGLFP